MNRILIIDDEETVLFSLNKIFTDMGYQVKVARDGKEGIELFNDEQDFNLVITDIKMPGMSGNAVARYIRNSERAGTPIVAITGYADMIQSDSFDFVLGKPFELATLIDVVKSCTLDRDDDAT